MFNRIKELRTVVASLSNPGLVTASPNPRAKLAMQIVISLTLLGAGLYILLTFDSDSVMREIAAGWIGMLIQYWLT